MATSTATRAAAFLLLSAALAALIWLVVGDPIPDHDGQQAGDNDPWEENDPLPDFILIDHLGNPFTLEMLKDRWSFIFFGYTRCPEICPMTLSLLAAVKGEIAERGGEEEPPQVVFITIDPKHDTILQMERYVTWFDPEFVGLTGSRTEVERLAAGLDIPTVGAGDPEGTDGHPVDHSEEIYLIAPDGRLAAAIPSPHSAAAIATGYLQLQSEYTTR